jgi:hypothetical protein
VTVTVVAFAATTVNVEVAPALTLAGAAAIVTVGDSLFAVAPQPLRNTSSEKLMTAAKGDRIHLKGPATRTLRMLFLLPMFR